MKVKVQSIAVAVDSRAAEALLNLALPAKAALKLARLGQILDRERAAFDAARNGVIAKFGKVNRKTGRVEFDGGKYPQKIAPFNKAVCDLLDQEVEIEWERETVALPQRACLSAVHANALAPFVELTT